MSEGMMFSFRSNEEMELGTEFIKEELPNLLNEALDNPPNGQISVEAWVAAKAPTKYTELFRNKEWRKQVTDLFIHMYKQAKKIREENPGYKVVSEEMGVVSPFISDSKNLDTDSTAFRLDNMDEAYGRGIHTLWVLSNNNRLSGLFDDEPKLQKEITKFLGGTKMIKDVTQILTFFLSIIFEIPAETIKHDTNVLEYVKSLGELREEVE